MTVKPQHARSSLPQVEYNVVLVEEVNGPQDGTDVSWLLITTLPITTIAQLELIMDYYVAWRIIKVYFRTLKTGSQVEEIQLETVRRVQNYLAFYKIIAWRILYLVTHSSRLWTAPGDGSITLAGCGVGGGSRLWTAPGDGSITLLAYLSNSVSPLWTAPGDGSITLRDILLSEAVELWTAPGDGSITLVQSLEPQ